MKTLALLALASSLSFGAFASEIGEIDKAIERTIGKHVTIVGTSSEGVECSVSASGGRVSIINLAPGCIDTSNNTVNSECISDFETQFRTNTVKKLNISENYILAEVKTKDDEIYSSAITTKIEITVAKKTTVKVYSKKGLFNYKQILDCSFEK